MFFSSSTIRTDNRAMASVYPRSASAWADVRPPLSCDLQGIVPPGSAFCRTAAGPSLSAARRGYVPPRQLLTGGGLVALPKPQRQGGLAPAKLAERAGGRRVAGVPEVVEDTMKERQAL